MQRHESVAPGSTGLNLGGPWGYRREEPVRWITRARHRLGGGWCSTGTSVEAREGRSGSIQAEAVEEYVGAQGGGGSGWRSSMWWRQFEEGGGGGLL
jgi:hypothetical protein